MIPVGELKTVTRQRLKDARVLLSGRRYDGAMDACGYAIEIALKARICRHFRWPEFPHTRKEFENYAFLKSHGLDVLLTLSGQEKRIKGQFAADWSIVAKWDPQARYRSGKATRPSADAMIKATAVLLKRLCP